MYIVSLDYYFKYYSKPIQFFKHIVFANLPIYKYIICLYIMQKFYGTSAD